MVYTIYNLLIVERDPGGTELIASHELSVNLVRVLFVSQADTTTTDSRLLKRRILSMTGSLLERDLGTAPNASVMVLQRISLDSYPAKFWVVFYVRGIRLLPSRELPNNLLFICSQLISKEVTPMILRQIVSCIAHDRP